MHSSVCYDQQPLFLSYGRNHSIPISSENDCNTGLSLSLPDSAIHLNQVEILDNNNDNAHHRFDRTPVIATKRRPRLVPDNEKDANYYEKRTRNNESAKRSRDARRTKEQQIQDRVMFLQQENARLAFENQTIRYQLSQLHLLYNKNKP
ncbi:unnamed protein product [Adineta ricciae]|uniref:BZIP domain-containing protein n=1 Tax=Adineta ricciae TaxID=249248 RepID=A0A814NT17_ADIRI|nr:unnamed protein product [Adineta ricciae]CAF1227913.1 unnamed protein product [Adineta ricciae]